jgi:hypothetical protein
MIELLANWHQDHETALREHGVDSRLSIDENERPKRAARLDLSRGTRIGTAILWTNGDCELDALIPDSTEVVSEYRTIGSRDDLDRTMDWVIERM